MERNSQPFRLQCPFGPQGDQPEAIARLTEWIRAGTQHQTLLGITGSGKTFTMAAVIEQLNRPALILSPNKTLAAQLFSEFKELFPDNAVEYFVSYYDYYQPEAYVPSSDTFIEKDSSINENIERLRNSATRSLLDRRDVIIVASVSCIYGLGSPSNYTEMALPIATGATVERDDLLRRLTQMQYSRNNLDFRRGTFRARGDVVEVFPAYEEGRVIRFELFGDEVESILEVDPLRGEILAELDKVTIYPSGHYVTPKERVLAAVEGIEVELEERLRELKKADKLLEAQRLEQRCRQDLEMLREAGFCSGIENYSRYMDGRAPGQAPFTLLNYFPEDFVVFIDESHVSVPQVGAMFRGDRSRKETLVEHGFRLPSALDNRPLRFEEWEKLVKQAVYVSATPGPYEKVEAKDHVVEQIVRPTGLIDPPIEMRPARTQVDDLLHEIRKVTAAGFRTLVTTLTKRSAEELTTYLSELGVKVRYMHSEIDAIERMQILRDLRLGTFDVLIGINLLREGLDLPEVALVGVLDADKEGFLRSATSLIQTCGRAARNVEGRVILYADKETNSIRVTREEVERRRAVQQAYNAEHGITPRTIIKPIRDSIEALYEMDYSAPELPGEGASRVAEGAKLTPAEIREALERLRGDMYRAAEELRFEDAAKLRDEVKALEQRELELA
ncbi:excinuclease ABC subunit UvrB [Engelhardtia mirabilis]|uniref:UvrABC system protein B n=1 Tax=Engelhardtia mirabilis TaxID=2528011 RepID=A0A518BLT5_9BACT|nr:UvrABC system protein B [Planctomycetes bacterium Pla133]QDV02259.1 UvrABC system protein B [Planctomycetes bacterium Pla86]